VPTGHLPEKLESRAARLHDPGPRVEPDPVIASVHGERLA
jgi:hypothetical protein